MTKIVDNTNIVPYDWASGCSAWVLNDSARLLVKEERMAAGTREQLHLHKEQEQFFFILEGAAVLYVEGMAYSLGAGQGLQIPAQATHYIANESDLDVRFLVISAPGTRDKQPDRENIKP